MSSSWPDPEKIWFFTFVKIIQNFSIFSFYLAESWGETSVIQSLYCLVPPTVTHLCPLIKIKIPKYFSFLWLPGIKYTSSAYKTVFIHGAFTLSTCVKGINTGDKLFLLHYFLIYIYMQIRLVCESVPNSDNSWESKKAHTNRVNR